MQSSLDRIWIALTVALLALCGLIVGVDRASQAATAADPVRFVDSGGLPLGNAPLRILCYDAINETTPTGDYLLETDAVGHPIQPLSADCHFIAALHILHKQPSGKAGRGDDWWAYNTSWEPGTRQIHAAQGDIVIRDEWRLILFDVAATLEWMPPAGSSYINDLRTGFFSASAYLYDLTDGQMAIGPLEIRSGGEQWEGADFRIRAANDYRPTAQVGGMVPAPIKYLTTNGQNPVFSPGEIWLGRYWDGFDGLDPIGGAWTGEAGYRTLIHEWGHYALFLYDEYQDSDGDRRVETYCTCSDLPRVPAGTNGEPAICGGIAGDQAASVMAYHYTATEFWLQELPVACTGSDQHFVHGESDWATLARWGTIQGLTEPWVRAPTQTVAGPELGLAGDLFGRRPHPASPGFRTLLPLIQRDRESNMRQAVPMLHAPASITATADITVRLATSIPLFPAVLDSLHPQLYVGELMTATTDAKRLIHQGTTGGPRVSVTHLGDATLLGVPTTHGVAFAFVDLYGPREAPHGRLALDLADDAPLVGGDILLLRPDPWHASLDVTPGMDGPLLVALTVTLTSRTPMTVTPFAQLCTPDAAVGCPNTPSFRHPLTKSGDLRWTTTFTAAPGLELPHYAVLHVEEPGAGRLLRWVQMPGGVGPAHMDEHAPLRDGMVMVDATEQLTQPFSRVIIMPAASEAAVLAPLPPGVGGTVGQPLDTDVHVPGVEALPHGDRQLTTPVIFTLFHGQESITRLGITKSQLLLLHFSRGTGQWQIVPTSGRSEQLNWLATVPVHDDGIYAVGWSPTATFGQIPHKFADAGPVAPGEPIRYQIVLPAHQGLTEPTDAFIQDQLPPVMQFVGNLACSRGDCFFDAARNLVGWQGVIGADDQVLLSFTAQVDPEIAPSQCPPLLINQSRLFDGVMEQMVQAQTQLLCAVLPQ